MEISIDTNKKLISKAISFLRLPLMLIVVISHVNIGYHTMPLYETIYDILSVQIVQSAVCLFFFISGYLFFYNIQNTFTIRDYKKKLIKRVHSLLIHTYFGTLLSLFVLQYYIHFSQHLSMKTSIISTTSH